jgi:hypothetical protein
MTQNAFAVANSALKGIGLKLSESGERNVIELLNTLMVAENGRIRLPVQVRDEGGELPAAEYLTRLTKQNPGYFEPIDSPKPSDVPPVAPNMWAGLTAAMVAANAGKIANRRAELLAEVEEAGNPWSIKTFNRTRQGVISNLAPDVATRLKAEATR